MKLFPAVALAAAVVAMVGCLKGAAKLPDEAGVQAKGPKYENAEALKPDVLPYEATRLLLGGTEVPVTMSRKQSGETVTFVLAAHSETLEEEHYEANATGFRFLGATGETFKPAIPLVSYPFQVGESWEWTGTASLGPNTKSASAKLVSSTETLNLATGVAECVKVNASLTIDTGQGGVSKRELKFWFEPKKGMVRREFVMSSAREPRPQTEGS
ncbi:MAG: hypothetical protein JST30_02365 [Armatimonadetes bacterium]|nr:hypothetical protein [Armatimonadota bacterium]